MRPVRQVHRCVGCGREGHNARTCEARTTIAELQWKRAVRRQELDERKAMRRARAVRG